MSSAEPIELILTRPLHRQARLAAACEHTTTKKNVQLTRARVHINYAHTFRTVTHYALHYANSLLTLATICILVEERATPLYFFPS